MTELQDNDKLWAMYFDSFLSYKFNLQLYSSDDKFKEFIVKAYFGNFERMKNVDKVFWLHVYCRAKDLDLLKVIHLLGQIIEVHKLESAIYTHFPIQRPELSIASASIVPSQQFLGHIAIQVLFHYLMAACQELQEKCGCSNAMTSWYHHYRDLVGMLGSHISSTLNSSTDTSASTTMLNIMQAVFMLLQFLPDPNLVAEQTFSHLRDRHFEENLEVRFV